MLQYKIPQNVGIEDRIVGPFTLRQMIIIAIGGGISYVIFLLASKIYELNVLEYIIIALPAIIAVAAALIKINNISFTKYILLSLEFAIKPKKRLWDHRGISALVAPDLEEKKEEKKETTEEGKAKKDVNLEDISRVLDSGGFEHVEDVKHKDIDQASDEDLVSEAYFGHKKSKSDTENMYWRTKESHKKRLNILAKTPTTKVKSKSSVLSPKSSVLSPKSSVLSPKSSAPVAQSAPQVAPQTAVAEKPIKQPTPPVAPTVTAQAEESTAVKEKPIQKPAPPAPPSSTQPDRPSVKTGGQTVQPVRNPHKAGGGQPKKCPKCGEEMKEGHVCQITEEKQATSPQSAPPVRTDVSPGGQQAQQQDAPFEKKKRKRRRRRKPRSQRPVRDTQVNSTAKNRPVKFMSNQKPEQPQEQVFPDDKDIEGEIDFSDLQKGEIEINLD